MTMRVPLLDLRRVEPTLDEELLSAFKRVLESGHYILGREVEDFEQECARYLGITHAIGVSSGTDALLLAFMALGLGHGDEVICPTFTFFATAGSIWRTGARPVFVDSELRDFNCTAAAIEEKVTARTRAIVPVHLFGRCVEMGPIVELARKLEITVVEDAAQALGSTIGGQAAGTLGQVGAFSFFPSKNLGAFGDAGLVTTNDDVIAERMRALRAHGAKRKYHHDFVGGNFRIDALQAALLRPKLRRLGGWTEARQRNAALYSSLLRETGLAELNEGQAAATAELLYPSVGSGRHIFNQYVVRVMGGRRDELRAFLLERGIGTEVYYPVPMHMQKCFESLGYVEGDFPNAERASREALALPVFPELTEAELSYVVEQIQAFYA